MTKRIDELKILYERMKPLIRGNMALQRRLGERLPIDEGEVSHLIDKLNEFMSDLFEFAIEDQDALRKADLDHAESMRKLLDLVQKQKYITIMKANLSEHDGHHYSENCEYIKSTIPAIMKSS